MEAEIIDVLKRRCEMNAAQRDAAVEALAELVRYVRRVGGYMTHEDQALLWQAEAVIAEAGR